MIDGVSANFNHHKFLLVKLLTKLVADFIKSYYKICVGCGKMGQKNLYLYEIAPNQSFLSSLGVFELVLIGNLVNFAKNSFYF